MNDNRSLNKWKTLSYHTAQQFLTFSSSLRGFLLTYVIASPEEASLKVEEGSSRWRKASNLDEQSDRMHANVLFLLLYKQINISSMTSYNMFLKKSAKVICGTHL